ncbi:hypothetical protein LCGC14_2296750 [marine sediment metagenome]|uniref:Uncharacterized protein n=1 Tax=marine sediment metagenome TaxID=412755 RepID=A0A0F9CPP4_9ZZZZ
MAHNKPKLGKNGGWYQEPMRHSMSAKGMKTGRKIYEIKGPGAEEFRRLNPSWEQGDPMPQTTEFIPKKRIWLEGKERAVKGENIQYARAVRPSVYRKAAFKAGGMPAHARSYVPREYRTKKTKAAKQPGKVKTRKVMLEMFE